MTETDELLGRFGESIARFLDRAGKAQHSSGMFDLRRRTVIGSYVYFDHLPWALDVLDAHATPEQLGAGGRGLCGQPFSAQIHGILWGHLIARENELGLGRDGGDPDHLVRLTDWWRRTIEAYRGDGTLLPHEDGDRQPAAAPEQVRAVLDEHGRTPAELPDASRVMAAVQLYQYMLRGEQRGTTYYHGPYPGTEGTVLLVEEFTRLRRNELPWSADPPLLPFDTVCSVLELEDVALRFDLFQGMVADPTDYRDRVRRISLLTCDDGAPRSVTPEEASVLVEVAQAEQQRCFREMLEWDAEFRVSYAAYHYLDFLEPFFRAAGCGPEVLEEARQRTRATVERRLPELIATEPVPVWERLFARPEPLFAPLVGGVRA